MEKKSDSVRLAGEIDLTNAIQYLTENESLRKKVFETLYSKYILGQQPQNISTETKDFFQKFQFYVKQDPIAEYQLYEELQKIEDIIEHREVIQEQADEVRGRISFLEQSGPQPVQWLEEYDGERIKERQQVMSQILDLSPGDKIFVKAPFADKVFTITKHNRTQRVIVAESEEGEEKRILYRTPSVLEEFVKDVKKVLPSIKNKPQNPELSEDIKQAMRSELWAADQEKKRSKKTA